MIVGCRNQKSDVGCTLKKKKKKTEISEFVFVLCYKHGKAEVASPEISRQISFVC